MKQEDLYTYDEIFETSDRKHLLIGNGFSISCNPIFQYNNIFHFASRHGMSEEIRRLFAHYGTTNFEQVARALADTKFISELYDFETKESRTRLLSGVDEIKGSLVSAIAQTHLENPDSVSETKRSCCTQFLKRYHNVFTTNYDLLLYWVLMHGMETQELRFQDGFRSSIEEPDADYVVFSDHLGSHQGVFYLHGALHLFQVNGEVRKHCWGRSGIPLTQNVLGSLQNNEYPLFVAEGEYEKKRETIMRSGYLAYCFQKLQRVGSTLVVCGNSLGDSDRHILEAIADSDVTTVWLGVYGDHESADAKAMEVASMKLIERRRKTAGSKDLSVRFYDVRTAPIWERHEARRLPVDSVLSSTVQPLVVPA